MFVKAGEKDPAVVEFQADSWITFLLLVLFTSGAWYIFVVFLGALPYITNMIEKKVEGYHDNRAMRRIRC